MIEHIADPSGLTKNYTPLLKGLKAGNEHATIISIEAGAFVNVKNRSGKSPLDFALAMGTTDIIECSVSRSVSKSSIWINQMMEGISMPVDLETRDSCYVSVL